MINCAGLGKAGKTASRDKKTGEISHYLTQDLERVLQINLIGTFRCIALSSAGMLTLPALPNGERGAIVNTASAWRRGDQESSRSNRKGPLESSAGPFLFLLWARSIP